MKEKQFAVIYVTPDKRACSIQFACFKDEAEDNFRNQMKDKGLSYDSYGVIEVVQCD